MGEGGVDGWIRGKRKRKVAVHDLVRNAGWPFQNASAKPDTLSKTKRRSNWWNQRKREIKKIVSPLANSVRV